MVNSRLIQRWEGKTLLPGILIAAVDFDGTITTNPKFSSEPLTLVRNAKAVLHSLHADDVRLILWTCRTSGYLKQAVEFLKEHGMYHWFTAVNQHIPEIKEKYSPGLSRKIGADVYIDNANALFDMNPEDYWLEVGSYIYGTRRYKVNENR